VHFLALSTGHTVACLGVDSFPPATPNTGIRSPPTGKDFPVRRKIFCLCFLAALVCLFAGSERSAQAQAAPVLITQNVDETRLVTLEGNTRPEARAQYDRGPVADDLELEHMLLLLKRAPERQREVDRLIENLHDSSSPSFHQWLTARDLGERYGVAEQDRAAIVNWLRSHRFTVNVDYANGLLIDFSGSAGQVREAFHTEMHNLEVRGVKHIANMGDPQIPVALAPVIQGVVSLNDFQPHPGMKPRTQYTVSEDGSEHYLVVPGDLATIYNLKKLFNSGVSGQGQTIVTLEDTDVYTADDWTSFRSTFGLSAYTDGSFSQVHPAAASGANNCSDPGVVFGSETEAILDVEYASAAAPSATITLASCTSTTTTFGGLIAMQNLLNASSKPPAVVSMSYGMCEASNGAASNAAFNTTFEQAVTEGVSVFVAAGDGAAAFCDKDDEDSIYGIGVTGWGSSPHDVAVGGTDFGDTYSGTIGSYWGANSATYESALSYVPEIPWDDSCASSLLTKHYGYSEPYGTDGFCNSIKGETDYMNTVGGGGGPSGCATGTPSEPGVVSGTCAGWAKPSYQSVLGNPEDGVRDLPDVSLFAANGVWLHAYPYCFSGPGGVPCTEAPVNWPQSGGTSFAAPIMAGIQALVNQRAGARQGNPNFTYYKLAKAEYGTTGSTVCNASLGSGVASTCIFHDVTLGNNDVDCATNIEFGANDCYLPSGDNGVLSTSDGSYEPAYATTTGWDFPTGIGSVNAYNLVSNWPGVAPGFAISAAPASVTVVQGKTGTSTITIDPSGGFTGEVTFSVSGLPSGVTAAFSANPATTTSILTLTAATTAPTGTATVTIKGTSGTLTDNTTISLTVSPLVKSFSLSAAPAAVTIANGGAAGTSTVTITPLNGFDSGVTLSASGLPAGVTASFGTNPATTSSVLSLSATKSATTGTVTVTITGVSGALTKTTTIQLTVTQAPTFSLSASPASLTIRQASSGTSTITIAPLNGFDSGVTFSASGLPAGVTAAFSPNPGTTTTTLALTASATAATGTSTVTISGTSGSLTETATLQLTVSLAYKLAASPTAVTVVQGGTGASTITVTPLNGFKSDVTLAASGLPTGVTAAFSPNPTAGTSTLTFTASGTATAGTATVTITGTSGGLTQATTITLKVTPAFTLAASPAAVSVIEGSTATSTITISPLNGFKGSVTFSASGLPAGVTAAFSPNPATSTSTLTFTASAAATIGAATVTVTGTSGSTKQTTTISLTVKPAPNFSLSDDPASLTIDQLASGTSTITITPENGFTGKVALAASGLPKGVTVSFGTNPATSSSKMTLAVGATAATGTSTITITGTSGSLSHATTVKLTVDPGLALIATPASLTVTQGSTGATTVIANPDSSPVTFSISGLPSGVTATFSPNPAVENTEVTFKVSATATVGTSNVTVTGTADGLTATTTIAFTVKALGDFSLTAQPSPVTVPKGSTANTTITVVPTDGFDQQVTLAASGLPAGVTASFNPNPATATSTLKLAVSNSAAGGLSTITVSGGYEILLNDVGIGLIVQ
jgi:Pro-kumamolisin, activation domain